MEVSNQELETVNQEASDLAKIASQPVTDAVSYDMATSTLKAIKATLKKIEGIFDPLIKAQNDAVKAIRDEKKKHAEPLEAAEAMIKKSTAAYVAEQERKAKEEAAARRKQQEEEAANLAALGINDEPVACAPDAPAVAKIEGVSYRETWKFEITDQLALPRDYLVPNEQAIGAAVRSLKSMANIPGVRVWSEKTVAVR
jgi:hypothetical protein